MTKPTGKPRRFITVTEAAEALNVNTSTVRRWCEDGKIKAEFVGKAWLIPARSLQGISPVETRRKAGRPKTKTS